MRFRKMLGQSSVGNCSIFRGCFSVKCLQLSMLLLQLRFVKRGLCLSRYSRQASDATRATVNPLLGTFNALNFQVSAQHVEEAIPQLVKQTDEKFKEFEQILDRRFKNKEPLSWQTVVQPIEDITDRIKISWGVVSHLHNVKNSDGFREAYSKVNAEGIHGDIVIYRVLPEVITLLTRISQSKPVYEAFKTLSNGSHDLDEAQQRIIASAIKSAYHSGVSLEGQQKERFNAIVQELAALSTTFSNNVLDSVKAFGIMIEDPKDVEGLPETLLQLIAKAAASQLNKTADAEKGPWKLTLDTPCFEPFMKHSTNRPMRERLFKAMITRASSGTHDNREVITSIRKLRQETAEILGFPNYAHVSLDTKMAANPKEVMDMIENLKNKSKPIAQKEISTLIDFAAKAGFKDPVSLWDFSYFGERQRETLFSLKEEEIRVYFPLPRVLDGLFKLSSELFGIDIKSADGEADVWDQTIRYFKVFDKNGDFIASFYLDPYSRPNEKRGGAWMDSAISRSDHLNRKPIAYLVCNQSPPNGDKPALMTFGEVNTLFHEFGHGLQHMLTQVKYPEAAGTANIEWDAVEVPSQFMESWLYDWPTIQSVSGHYKTGETLPREFFDRLLKARTYMAGSGMLRQLYFAALDLELHTSNESWPIVMKRIADDYTVVKPLPEDMFPCSFTHIFAGGYAAGYYSYKWAEVMAADAFSAFEDVGLQNRKEVSEVGKRFRKTFLALGGGRDPKKVFIDFRGRDYKTDALLHQYGMK